MVINDFGSLENAMLDESRVSIIWNEYKEQRDWQRHNEIQRAQLTSILLTINL